MKVAYLPSRATVTSTLQSVSPINVAGGRLDQMLIWAFEGRQQFLQRQRRLERATLATGGSRVVKIGSAGNATTFSMTCQSSSVSASTALNRHRSIVKSQIAAQ